jgi:hypothetical protein
MRRLPLHVTTMSMKTIKAMTISPNLPPDQGSKRAQRARRSKGACRHTRVSLQPERGEGAQNIARTPFSP